MKLKNIDLSIGEKLLYPSKPIIVTAEYGGRLGGMLASWWTQLSFKPFYIGVAIGFERYTYKLIDKAKIYGLNFIGFEYVDKTPYLGDVSERFFMDKLRRGGFKIFRGEALNAPLLEDAYLAMELNLSNNIVIGDHVLVVGEVKNIYAAELFDKDYTWRLDLIKPLFYMGRVKKDGKQFRRYVSWSKTIYRDLVYGGGVFRESFLRRREVRRKVINLLSKSSPLTLEEALNKAMSLLEEYGVDGDDAIYYVREALSSGDVKIIDFD